MIVCVPGKELEHIPVMTNILNVFILIGLAATTAVLIAGVANMFTKGKGRPGRSNALMRWRVILQTMVILFLALLLLWNR